MYLEHPWAKWYEDERVSPPCGMCIATRSWYRNLKYSTRCPRICVITTILIFYVCTSNRVAIQWMWMYICFHLHLDFLISCMRIVGLFYWQFDTFGHDDCNGYDLTTRLAKSESVSDVWKVIKGITFSFILILAKI